MKWTIQELIKLENTNNQYAETLDFSTYIKETDIIKISPVKITGEFETYENEEFVFYTRIQCDITMECALTLEEVVVPLDFEVEDVFTTYKDENNFYIEGITIDLLPVIWSNILLEKPMRVIADGAEEKFSYENTEDDEENTNAFSKLKTN